MLGKQIFKDSRKSLKDTFDMRTDSLHFLREDVQSANSDKFGDGNSISCAGEARLVMDAGRSLEVPFYN